MVAAGQFREDLWFRINAFEIHLPPLRELIEDVPELARHLAMRFRPNVRPDDELFTPDAMAILTDHCWPGNVRELANVIEHAMILCERLPISPEHLPLKFASRRPRSVAAAGSGSGGQTLRDREIQAIYDALDRSGGNKPKAAQELGISLKTLYNRLNQAAVMGKTG
jgi:two-component system NtrC family response regulator